MCADVTGVANQVTYEGKVHWMECERCYRAATGSSVVNRRQLISLAGGLLRKPAPGNSMVVDGGEFGP